MTQASELKWSAERKTQSHLQECTTLKYVAVWHTKQSVVLSWIDGDGWATDLSDEQSKHEQYVVPQGSLLGPALLSSQTATKLCFHRVTDLKELTHCSSRLRPSLWIVSLKAKSRFLWIMPSIDQTTRVENQTHENQQETVELQRLHSPLQQQSCSLLVLVVKPNATFLQGQTTSYLCIVIINTIQSLLLMLSLLLVVLLSLLFFSLPCTKLCYNFVLILILFLCFCLNYCWVKVRSLYRPLWFATSPTDISPSREICACISFILKQINTYKCNVILNIFYSFIYFKYYKHLQPWVQERAGVDNGWMYLTNRAGWWNSGLTSLEPGRDLAVHLGTNNNKTLRSRGKSQWSLSDLRIAFAQCATRSLKSVKRLQTFREEPHLSPRLHECSLVRDGFQGVLIQSKNDSRVWREFKLSSPRQTFNSINLFVKR